MKSFGLAYPTTTSHLNTILTLGKELHICGHQVALFGKQDAKKMVASRAHLEITQWFGSNSN
jgi:UDP:flavonoid glycosyltransferase YjiC (YdhE family)